MDEITFVSFGDIDPEAMLPIVNEESVRKHLIDHQYFDSVSVKEWMNMKIETESLSGCCIRAVFIKQALAGWCGIQPDDNGFEIAIVISRKFWGSGFSIFKAMMGWAKELGHKEVVLHLLETRPEYNALKRKATKIQTTEQLGRSFTTYFISVDEWHAGRYLE